MNPAFLRPLTFDDSAVVQVYVAKENPFTLLRNVNFGEVNEGQETDTPAP